MASTYLACTCKPWLRFHRDTWRVNESPREAREHFASRLKPGFDSDLGCFFLFFFLFFFVFQKMKRKLSPPPLGRARNSEAGAQTKYTI